MAELSPEGSCDSCGRWCQWWWQWRVAHGFCVPEQRAERLQGLYVTSGGSVEASVITSLTCSVGLMSMETTGLRPLDLSTSIAQSSAGLSGIGLSSRDLPCLVGLWFPWGPYIHCGEWPGFSSLLLIP